jgi:hypothetical protein
MLKKSIIILILLLITAFILKHGEIALAAKPLPPLKVVIEPEKSPKAGETVKFFVKAYPKIDSGNFKLWVEIPKGIELVSGALEWSGEVKKGEEYILTFTIKAPGNVFYVITAGASIGHEGGGFFSDRVSYSLGKEAQKEKPKPKKAVRDNQGVVEYELK